MRDAASEVDRRARASESVAARFTRVMNATPAPRGVLSDVTFAAAGTGLFVVTGLAVASAAGRPGHPAAIALFAASVLPVIVVVVASVALRGSRDLVVGWLASLPFPVENLNALLAGLGDGIEVVFAPSAAMPVRARVQPLLDAVSDDVLWVRERPAERAVEIRLGVIDSKRNPFRSNHLRWLRLRAVVERVLVPLDREVGIEVVRVT